MNNLINITNKDGKLTVSSREVAERFEKRHDHVLRDIEEYISKVYDAPLKLQHNLNRLNEIDDELREYPYIRMMLTEYTMFIFKQSQPTEFDVQHWFNTIGYKSFDGYVLANKKNDSKHVPDAWLKCEGDFIPVEVKLHDFDIKALKQLMRYMKHYDSSEGVAVGDKLTCDLPENIKFLKYDKITVYENC